MYSSVRIKSFIRHVSGIHPATTQLLAWGSHNYKHLQMFVVARWEAVEEQTHRLPAYLNLSKSQTWYTV